MSEPVKWGIWAMYLGCLKWAMQGLCTVYSTTWEGGTRKATNPVSQLHSTPIGRHRQNDWPGQAVWIGTGLLWLEEDCSRLLCSRQMMMMMTRGRGGKLLVGRAVQGGGGRELRWSVQHRSYESPLRCGQTNTNSLHWSWNKKHKLKHGRKS